MLALSYKNLSAQQKEQILAQMGLIASENTIQSELLQTTLAQKGVSAEKSKAILIELGLMNQQTGELLTQKACTKADLEAILAQKGITGAQAEGIISALGLSGANAGLTASFGLLGKAIWGVTKALLSNPITWIVAGFAGLVAITDAVTTSTEEYKEQLDDLKSEYNEITSEIQSVNSELQTTIDRMKELEGKDSLTFTEKEEYDNLVKTNNELQRKIDLLELEEKQKNKEKNKTFVDTMVSDTENPFEHEVNPNGKTEGQYQISDNYLTSETGYIEAQFEIRDQLLEDLANAETEKEKERIQKRIDEIEKYLNDKNDEWKNVSDGISYIENPTTEDDKAVNEWLDYIADFQDRMAIAMGGDNAKTNTFNRLVDNWQFDEIVQGLQDLGTQGKVTAEMLNDPKYDEFINKLVELGVIDSADNLNDIAKAFNGLYSDSYQNLIDLFGQDAVDKLTPEDLEIAYTISSEEADKALEQEKNKVKSELKSLSKEGNVDLTIRPVIDSSAMQAAGWDVEDGSIATTFTQGEFIWQGDEENGQYVYIHYTPILPDGTVLTPDELTDYLYGTLEGSQSVLDADNKGIVLKVDTDLNIPEDDIKKFTNGEGSTDAIDGLIQKTGEWDDKVHGVQEQYYDTGEGIGYASNALDGLIEKHKQLENGNGITVSDVFSLEDAEGKATPLSDLNDQLSDVTSAYETCLAARDEYNKQGYLSVDTLQSVLALGDEYLQYLFDEEGNVSLDAEAFQKLTLARINDMETQALNDLANNIKQITDEAKATEYLAQKQNELASSYTDTAINALVAMKSIAGFSDSEALQGAYNSFVTQYEQIKSLFAKTKAGIKTEYSGISDKDTNTTDYKSILDKEITAQEKAYEAGKTTFKKYLDNRKQLVEKYYHDKKITTAEYYEELEDLAQAEADFYDDVLAAVTRRIQREIDGIQDIIDGIQKQIDQLEKQKDTYDSVISAVTRRYDKEIESINDVIEALEKQNEELEKQQDNYDGAIGAIVKFLESQKDAIQDNIDSINDENDAIQDQIDQYDQLLNAVTLVFNEKRDALQAEQDAIDDRIDALQAENDEYQKAIELEKAKNELLKAKTQRSRYLYAGEGKGFIYQTDTDAIADAEQTLSELTFESTIEALETEKQLLQDVIDKLDETEQAWQDIADAFDNKKAKSTAQELFGDDYENIILNGDPDMIASIMNQYTSAQQKLEDNDNTITSLEEQMAQFDEMIEKWESVASAKEDATNREYAALLLGQQWQQIILSNRETDFENFKNKYLAIQDQIEDNQTLIDSYNEKIEYYENLKAEWEELSSLYQEMLEDKMAQDILGADWEAQIQAGRLEAFDAFKDNYLSIQAQIDDNQSLIDSYNEKIEYYENLKAEWEDISDVYQREVDDQLITQALGANGEADILSGRLETLNAFKEQYVAAQQALADAAWASANEQIKAAKESEKGANGTTGDSPDITNETTATPQYLSPSKTNVERIAEDLAQFADDFESGSTKSGGGTTALDKRLRLQAYAKGGIINDENSSGALDWLAKLLGEDHTVVVGNGERVLSQKDNQAYEKLLDLSSRIQPNIPDVNVNPFDYTKIRSENREMNVTQNINITLPNVTNTSGYDKLVKELQGLQIMAYQNSFKK